MGKRGKNTADEITFLIIEPHKKTYSMGLFVNVASRMPASIAAFNLLKYEHNLVNISKMLNVILMILVSPKACN